MIKFDKNPRNRNKRNFLIFSIVFIILTPTSFFFRYNSSLEEEILGIPELYINCNQAINDENYISGEVKLNNLVILTQIKYRGAGYTKTPKMGYRLELERDYSLLGMRSDDDWQLFSCYVDHTRMRTKLAFELWRSLLPSNPTAILPKSEYVKLYINNKFQGLYLLSEKQDRMLYGLDEAQDNLKSSLILQVSGQDVHYNFRDIGYWEQDYPNKEDGINIADQIIEGLTHYINNTSDHEFFDEITGIYSKFDKMNLIDFYLFNRFIYHRDFWNKNYYLVRNTMPSKFFLIPWDFDYTFGQFFWNMNDQNLIIEISNQNLLFERLINNTGFIREVNNRWAELRAELWTNDYTIGLITKIYHQIHKLIEIDIDMWLDKTQDGDTTQGSHQLFVNEDLDFSEAIPFLFDWITNRLDFCDKYFSLN